MSIKSFFSGLCYIIKLMLKLVFVAQEFLLVGFIGHFTSYLFRRNVDGVTHIAICCV